MEIDLRCGKTLPQLWIIQFTNKIVPSVLAFIKRNPGVPFLAVGIFNSVFSCTVILGTNRYYRRKDEEEIARLEEMMDGLTGSTKS